MRSGAQGIVFAGTGAGDLPETSLELAQALQNSSGVPMVFSSRVMNGFVLPSTANSWQIPAAGLSPQKARIMLQLAIATGLDLAEVCKKRACVFEGLTRHKTLHHRRAVACSRVDIEQKTT